MPACMSECVCVCVCRYVCTCLYSQVQSELVSADVPWNDIGPSSAVVMHSCNRTHIHTHEHTCLSPDLLADLLASTYTSYIPRKHTYTPTCMLTTCASSQHVNSIGCRLHLVYQSSLFWMKREAVLTRCACLLWSDVSFSPQWTNGTVAGQ
jgi:hypothetical protein